MPNTVIQLKKSATPSAQPASLANGELALNFADGVLYYKASNGTIASISGAGAGPSYGVVNANGTLLLAGVSGDTLAILPGQNITITGDAINDRVTINADLTAANNYAGAMANAANAYAATTFGTVTNTTASFAAANQAGVIANAAFNKANTGSGLANTSGVSFNGDLFFPTGNVAVGASSATFNSVAYRLYVNGAFAANTKSFVIDHPTKSGLKLQHGSLEGPENGVYVRGKIEGNVIELPDYWTGLVDEDTITVQLTAIGRSQNLYVVEVSNNKVFIDSENHTVPECYYTVYGERKDVENLVVEY